MRGILAVLGSLCLHGLGLLVLLPVLSPQPVPEQTGASSRIEMAVMRVTRSQAQEAAPDTAPAPERAAQGARVAGDIVRQRRVDATDADGRFSQEVQPDQNVQSAKNLPGSDVRPVATTMEVGSAMIADAITAEALTLPGTNAAAVAPAGVRAARANVSAPLTASVAVQFDVADVVAMQGTNVVSQPPLSLRAPRADPAPLVWVEVQPHAQAAALVSAPQTGVAQSAQLGGVALDEMGPEIIRVAQTAPPVTRIDGGPGWSGAGDIALDAQSLATLQALLQPGAAAAEDLHDSVRAVLAAPECARIQTVFDETTGALELRGHVPNLDAAAPLVAALRAEIGAALPLQQNLRLLPRPQCDILDGVAALGLPQSEEQLTNTQLIGENAHVREYAFEDGDRLVIDLVAPEYPAFVYVDYFDAQGQVLHLTPNEFAPLSKYPAKAAFSIGRGGALDLRISPPFGQDIAVAFASNAPLYDGLRPVVEPAEAYLTWLQDRVAEARVRHEGFKGEWVYLFVATRPKVD